jgi:TPR repeat protein
MTYAASYPLGWMYEKGRGVAQNSTEAVKWYRKTAEQGNKKPQDALNAMKE